MERVQIFAGILSSAIYLASNLPMVLKVLRTHDLRSYSLGQLVLRNLGNLIYWFYVTSLPYGPLWWLQAFFTLSGAVMLVCYLHYEKSGLKRPLLPAGPALARIPGLRCDG